MSLHSLALISSSPIGEGPNFRLDTDAQSAALESNGNFRGGHNAKDSDFGDDRQDHRPAMRPLVEEAAELVVDGRLPDLPARVGLQLGNPLNVIRDSASGEMKGRI